MAKKPSRGSSPPSGGSGTRLDVRLELRREGEKPVIFDVARDGFLVGSVPGCDLRLPGKDLPPVLCLITPRSGGVGIRKLALTHPLMINNKTAAGALLGNGDKVAVGGVELKVHIRMASAPAPLANPDLDAAQHKREQELKKLEQELEARQAQVDEQTQDLEADRVIWYRRRTEIEEECRKIQEQCQRIGLVPPNEDQQEIARKKQELLVEAERLEADKKEVETVRKELAALRKQLYAHYHERRDRLAGMHQSITKAAQKIQDHKRKLDAEAEQLAERKQDEDTRRAELEAKAKEVEQERQRLARQASEMAGLNTDIAGKIQDQEAELVERKNHLDQGRQALEKDQAEFQAKHKEEIFRLDRLQASLEKRQQQVDALAADIDGQQQQLQKDSKELEDQARQLQDWQSQLQQEADRLAKEKTDLDPRSMDLAKRTASMEEQQGVLTSLRAHLERQRQDMEREEKVLDHQRTQQQETEANLARQLQKAQRLREYLEKERGQLEEERQQLDEDRAELERTSAEVDKLKEQLAAQDQEGRVRTLALDNKSVQLVEEENRLKERATQLSALQERLAVDRQTLRERETTLIQAEQARESLQEQLRRRAEELTTRNQEMAELGRLRADEVTLFEARKVELERRQKEAEDRLEAVRQELAEKTMTLREREDNLHRKTELLKENGQKVAQQRKSLGEAALLATESREALKRLKEEAAELHRQLPDWELRAQAAAERLARAREQLREHLAELHNYVRHSHEDFEALQAQVQAGADRVLAQELALRRSREEHRAAVASFRQQLIEWQGYMKDMKHTLATDETRLERRQAHVEQTSAKLSKQAEVLQEQEREVAVRRVEMNRHLVDMREWYRRKLRELAGEPGASAPGGRSQESGVRGQESGIRSPESTEEGFTPVAGRDILALTGDIAAGDRQLGDLLRSLELIDADTLTTLLVEARKQRRSLRQVLLSSGSVTLYQMALIEAGNLDGLLLGSVRVLDRLRATAQESVYLVFDPRRGNDSKGTAQAVLRILSENELLDAVRPDEFRQRFAAAALVQHPNLLTTHEVLDIHGRPAVLQEWLTGLPGTDWPHLVGVPGVWLRLMRQATLGLHHAHQAGLVHGRLDAYHLLLTGEGNLKICGLGEPPWLATLEVRSQDSEEEDQTKAPRILKPGVSPGDDLAALGNLASTWLVLGARGKGTKAKSPPKPIQNILTRLHADPAATRYPNAAALLDDLDQAGGEVPPNPEAWDRLLAHVREHGAETTALRETA